MPELEINYLLFTVLLFTLNGEISKYWKGVCLS
jgi:hypothetical protein